MHTQCSFLIWWLFSFTQPCEKANLTKQSTNELSLCLIVTKCLRTCRWKFFMCLVCALQIADEKCKQHNDICHICKKAPFQIVHFIIISYRGFNITLQSGSHMVFAFSTWDNQIMWLTKLKPYAACEKKGSKSIIQCNRN